MSTLYAHRLFHGAGCGHTIILDLRSEPIEQDVVVHEITSEMIQKFIKDYVELSTSDEILPDFIDIEKLERFLMHLAEGAYGRRLNDSEKAFLRNAHLHIGDQLDALDAKSEEPQLAGAQS